MLILQTAVQGRTSHCKQVNERYATCMTNGTSTVTAIIELQPPPHPFMGVRPKLSTAWVEAGVRAQVCSSFVDECTTAIGSSWAHFEGYRLHKHVHHNNESYSVL